jgi:hypothetical protein
VCVLFCFVLFCDVIRFISHFHALGRSPSPETKAERAKRKRERSELEAEQARKLKIAREEEKEKKLKDLQVCLIACFIILY